MAHAPIRSAKRRALREQLLQEVRNLRREKEQQPPLDGGEATFRGVRALSMFDGIGCALVAMKQAGIPVRSWAAVEWDERVRRVG